MRYCRFAFVLTMGAALLPGQSMLESATAAAGGSVAGVAGKTVSDGVDKVMGRIGDIASKAAKVDDKNKPGRLAREAPPVPEIRTPLLPAAHPIQAAKPAKGQGTIARTIVPDYPAPATPSARESAALSTAPPQPTPADIQAVAFGSTREDVVGKLGRPTSRISMADSSGLVEIYTYSTRDERIGSVRLVNGKVQDVRPNVP